MKTDPHRQQVSDEITKKMTFGSNTRTMHSRLSGKFHEDAMEADAAEKTRDKQY